jgi:F0F1-type ATP synthase assembly protein I
MVLGLFDNLNTKLRGANTALAEASKEWRDADIDSRAQALQAHERAAAAKMAEAEAMLAQVRKSEARWLRQKVGFAAGMLVAVVPGFLLGIVTVTLFDQTAGSSPQPPAQPAVEPIAAPQGMTESTGASDEASSAAQLESSSKSMSFERCISTIQDMSGQLGVAPNNIVETDVMRMVRFRASDGSVLVTCSRPDQRMVITRSPNR